MCEISNADCVLATTDSTVNSVNISLPYSSTATQTNVVPISNVSVQTENKPIFSLSNFSRDSDMVHFYTGLECYEKVICVLNSLGPAAYHLNYMYGAFNGLSTEDQFFLVLIRLRQYKTNLELSKLFSISQADAYNIFCTWIRFMSLQWRELDIWPSRDLVQFYSPIDFKKKFPSTRIIIDGTECPVKRPSMPVAQQSTFSTYKNRNTVKVLVGATPAGLVSYVSRAYGGSTSDRQIVERSNVLLSGCEPGDSIMADKGFDVQDIFATRNVRINIPTFFRKQNKITSNTVIRDRRISSKRVHIERIIGLGKTFKILTHALNFSETKLSSDIIFTCFMLCNFRRQIVPRDA